MQVNDIKCLSCYIGSLMLLAEFKCCICYDYAGEIKGLAKTQGFHIRTAYH